MSKAGDKILIALMAGAMLAVALAVMILPQESFSENENRVLTTWQDIEFLSELSRGTLGARLSALFADQFPARSVLIECRALAELALGKRENGGVMLGRGGALIPRAEYSAAKKENLEKNIDAINKFCESTGAKTIFAVAPRAVDVMGAEAPLAFSSARAESAWGLLAETEHIDLRGLFEPNDWFLTDHHWTVRGAHKVYSALGAYLGYEPRSDLYYETVSDEFYGTAWSKSGMYFVAPDRLELARFYGDDEFYVTDGDGERIMSGLYDGKKLGTKDKYGVFLGGDYGHIKISGGESENGGGIGEKPRLLVIKDSYFNSLAPFLCRHFELDIIDLRYFSGSVAHYAEEQGIGYILILCGIDSLATAPTFESLLYGIKIK